ncbi:MAG: PilZ domain-containing protein [Myxococcota bacterium]
MHRSLPIARNAVVRVDRTSHRGMVHACYADRAMVGFHGSAPPVFSLGQRVQLVLSGGTLIDPVHGEATVVERVEGRGVRQYTLELDDSFFPEGDANVASGPERRFWTRVRAPVDVPVPVGVTVLDGSGSLVESLTQPGRLVDVSGGGLGVELLEHQEGDLVAFDTVRVRFRPPRTEANVERECSIRSRALTDMGIRLGLQFVMLEDAALVFEPMWRCKECGEDGLLESAHPHCCGCGTVRASNATLADWGDLVSRKEHRYTGDARTCTACGAGWSALAAFCGLCGTALDA